VASLDVALSRSVVWHDEVEALVNNVVAKHSPSAAELKKLLQHNTDLSAAQRRAALALAQERGKAWWLNRAAWGIAKKAGAQVESYRHALSLAEAAYRLDPHTGWYLNTVGVAQYRTGNYEKALHTLCTAAELMDVLPDNVAFVALTSHRLGHAARARRAFERLSNLMQESVWAEDQDGQNFLSEVGVQLGSQSKHRPSGTLDSALTPTSGAYSGFNAEARRKDHPHTELRQEDR
jgi:tetratricopeptide (TPR) repeat protein